MEPKKIAIIHRDEPGNTLANLAQFLGYTTSTMQVGMGTTPQQVASFVDGVEPNLVLLAENYISFNDPAVRAYFTQREYEVTLEGVKGIKGGEGIEALVKIRENHPNLPVFMVSGGPRHKEEAMKKGATGYLILPVGLKQYGTFLEHAFELGP